MSGRRAAWICAELVAAAEERARAGGGELDRAEAHRVLWPQAKRLASSQKWLAKVAGWYETALADATQDARAAVSAVHAVVAAAGEPARECPVPPEGDPPRPAIPWDLDPVAWAEEATREAV